ncbi:PQQ-binding-like beta-propeller repeat protein [Streptomyces sp. NRRL S-1448]|uniref:outer membrane protein assembly factor BamB family protein n=1 Tax=Streptomyces sp. NRRL S-1448 TaxID=1463883 RepID=UPI00055D3675|nr:PQQ-binding-like beta-propeller repeat protein [Streptomyces sp. NRRL S-1448]
MSSLDELLKARPTKQVWHQVCLLLAELDEEGLAAVAPRVLAWPAQQRPMPDDWWAQWTAGDVRPYHSLAGVRHLGRLGVAEGEGEVGEDAAEAEETGLDEAYFYHGATALAAPSDLSWVALGAAAEWHHNGGDIIRWDTVAKDRLTWFLHGANYHDEPHDMQVSPDGRTVVTSVEGHLYAWSAATGDQLWTRPASSGPSGSSGSSDRNDEDADADTDADDFDDEDEGEHDFEDEDDFEEEDDFEDDLEDEVSLGMDDPVRIGFSGDGRRVATGTCVSGRVAVMEADTGRVVLTVPAEEKAFGPVALDASGRLLAHTSPEGRVVVRQVDSGAVLATIPTRLSQVHALAVSPEGTAVFVVGAVAEDAAPAAQLLSLEPAPTVGELIRPTEFPVTIGRHSVLAGSGTRAVWTGRGPYAFVQTGNGSVLFDSTARTLWADPNQQTVSFTPDGHAVVTVHETIEAWFLAGLAAPEPPAAAIG